MLSVPASSRVYETPALISERDDKVGPVVLLTTTTTMEARVERLSRLENEIRELSVKFADHASEIGQILKELQWGIGATPVKTPLQLQTPDSMPRMRVAEVGGVWKRPAYGDNSPRAPVTFKAPERALGDAFGRFVEPHGDASDGIESSQPELVTARGLPQPTLPELPKPDSSVGLDNSVDSDKTASDLPTDSVSDSRPKLVEHLRTIAQTPMMAPTVDVRPVQAELTLEPEQREFLTEPTDEYQKRWSQFRPEDFHIDRVETIEDLWSIWFVGTATKPSIVWMQQAVPDLKLWLYHTGDRDWFRRRQHVIDEITYFVDGGMQLETVIERAKEALREHNGLAKLSTALSKAHTNGKHLFY